MLNNISNTLKTLRVRKGITQEQLASHLGVTYQAVSKWERGEGYPDIIMLPAIANYFEISTDELLGVDVTKKRAAIEDVVTKANTFYHDGDLENVQRVLEEGLAKYPNAHILLLELVQLKYKMPYKSRDEKDAVVTSSIITLERILDESTDGIIRNFATKLLIRHYTYMNRREEAIALAKGQADINSSSTVLLCDLTEGEERIRHIQNTIRLTLEELNSLFSRLGDYNTDNGYSVDEKIAIRELAIRVNELVLGTEAHVGFGWNYWKRCEQIARGYAMKGDAENTLLWLEKAAVIACAHDKLSCEQISYTVLPLKGCVYDMAKTMKNYVESEYDGFTKCLQNKIYEFVKNESRFLKL